MNIECDICFKAFDLSQAQPMFLPCGHSLCKMCAESFEKCPLDQSPYDKSKLVRNYALIRLLEESAAKNPPHLLPERKCQRHGQKIKIFCIDHQEEICSECHLLLHTRHEVKSFKHYMAMLEALKSKVCEINDFAGKGIQSQRQEERENLMKMLMDEKRRVTDRIKDRYQRAIDSIYDCLSQTLNCVEEIFAKSENVIEDLIKDSAISHNTQLSNLIDEALKNMDSFGKLDIKQLNKDIINRIVETHSLMQKIEQEQKKAFRKPVVDLPSVTSAIAQNVLEAFNAYFLPADNYLCKIIYDPLLNFFVACNSPHFPSSKVLVSDPSQTLTREALIDLVSSYSPFEEFEITAIRNFSQANDFAVAFETTNEAQSLLFLRSTLVNGSALNMKLVDKSTVAFEPEWNVPPFEELAMRRKSNDEKFVAMASELANQIRQEIIPSYQQAAVEINDFGLQSTRFLHLLLLSMVRKFKAFNR